MIAALDTLDEALPAAVEGGTPKRRARTPAPITTIRVSLTEADAANYIGMTRAFMRKARTEGRGPAYMRLGRTVRYRLEDLDAYLTRHRVETRDSR